MDNAYEILFRLLGDFFKILLIGIMGIIIVEYVALNIIGYKAIKRAEVSGYLDQELFNEDLEKMNISREDIIMVAAEPFWGYKATKLGQTIRLDFKKKKIFLIFGKEVIFTYEINKMGINQGYYGEGY